MKKELVENLSPDTLRIDVREQAENGRANRRVKEILEESGYRQVRLVSGHTSPSKIFSVEV